VGGIYKVFECSHHVG